MLIRWLDRNRLSDARRYATALLLLTSYLATACGGAIVTQNVSRGTPREREERVANPYQATATPRDNGIEVEVAPAKCLKVTETPITTETATKSRPSYGAPIGFFAAAAGLGTLGGVGLASANDKPETCPTGDPDCTTQSKAKSASIGALVLAGAFAIAGTYFVAKAKGSEKTNSESTLERTQSAPYPCSKRSDIPVELRVGGRSFRALTDDGGHALLTFPTDRSWNGATSGVLWVDGHQVSTVPLAAGNGTPAEATLRPGPVAMIGSPYVAGSTLDGGTPILVDSQGDWYEARALGLDAGRVRVHYWGWESSWDETVASDRVRTLGPGEHVTHAPARTTADAVFGSADATPFALEGRVYAIPASTSRLPDFAGLSPIGKVYASRLDIPQRSFLEGFPGVTDRFEWFALDYRGSFGIRRGGDYRFRLTSDDGSRLLVDGRPVIDNDGLHATRALEGRVALSPGMHDIEVQYFQGPRTQVALVLELAGEGEGYRAFDTTRYSPTQVARDDAGNLHVTLAEGILFDTDAYVLKPEAQRVLDALKSSLLDRQEYASLRVEGHTDDRGTDRHNLELSDRRAKAVADWLKTHGVAPMKITTQGFGKSRPAVPNESDQSRARNRRVELVVGRGGASHASGSGAGFLGSVSGAAADDQGSIMGQVGDSQVDYPAGTSILPKMIGDYRLLKSEGIRGDKGFGVIGIYKRPNGSPGVLFVLGLTSALPDSDKLTDQIAGFPALVPEGSVAVAGLPTNSYVIGAVDESNSGRLFLHRASLSTIASRASALKKSLFGANANAR
jgi:outer membrane protein OmpA-like peptidoglycan-associated protein